MSLSQLMCGHTSFRKGHRALEPEGQECTRLGHVGKTFCFFNFL